MPKSTSVCNSLLALIFNATTWEGLAENDATSPVSNLYLSLHTSAPGAGGSQNTNEAAYTNYARVAVTRNTGGWDVPSGGGTANAALIQFPQCGVTGATITHVGIGTASSGAGNLLYSGALNSPLAVANLIQPQFAAGALTVTES